MKRKNGNGYPKNPKYNMGCKSFSSYLKMGLGNVTHQSTIPNGIYTFQTLHHGNSFITGYDSNHSPDGNSYTQKKDKNRNHGYQLSKY